jgi:hypothetical protein
MVNQQRHQQRSPAPQTGHTNYTTVEEIPTGEVVLAGMFILNECPIVLLFDSGALHDFISSTCATKAPYVISTPEG